MVLAWCSPRVFAKFIKQDFPAIIAIDGVEKFSSFFFGKVKSKLFQASRHFGFVNATVIIFINVVKHIPLHKIDKWAWCASLLWVCARVCRLRKYFGQIDCERCISMINFVLVSVRKSNVPICQSKTCCVTRKGIHSARPSHPFCRHGTTLCRLAVEIYVRNDCATGQHGNVC